jgi:hypothetical protein
VINRQDAKELKILASWRFTIMELVVARYEENLNWLRRVPGEFTITVYDKSTSPALNATLLPNNGREAHTYLHHICPRYDSLADITVFCQGKPFDHAFDFHHTLRALASGEMCVESFFWLGHIADTDSADGVLFRNWSKNEDGRGLDLNGFHRALFGCDGPREYAFFLGGQFIATRECIHRRSKKFYQRALRLSMEFPDAAHCFERTWDRVFGEEESTRARMKGEKTVYLKPIRRLRINHG